MSSWSTLRGVTITRRHDGSFYVLPEDHYHEHDDAPTEAGETGPEWPAESGADVVDESDDWIDDAMVMVEEAA